MVNYKILNKFKKGTETPPTNIEKVVEDSEKVEEPDEE